jgi:hypothetical protein
MNSTLIFTIGANLPKGLYNGGGCHPVQAKIQPDGTRVIIIPNNAPPDRVASNIKTLKQVEKKVQARERMRAKLAARR